MILAAGDQVGLLEEGLETRFIGDDVLHVRHAVVATNGMRPVPASHNMVIIWVHHVQTTLQATDS
jgi:hypothetical protein